MSSVREYLHKYVVGRELPQINFDADNTTVNRSKMEDTGQHLQRMGQY